MYVLEPLYIKAKDVFPKVELDKEKGIFMISGRSLPEDVDIFFNPIMTWFLKYAENPNPLTELNYQFDYYNSATVRKIVDIMVVLEQMQKRGFQVKVNWFYYDGDEIMRDNGIDFKNVMHIPFEIIALDSDDDE